MSDVDSYYFERPAYPKLPTPRSRSNLKLGPDTYDRAPMAAALVESPTIPYEFMPSRMPMGLGLGLPTRPAPDCMSALPPGECTAPHPPPSGPLPPRPESREKSPALKARSISPAPAPPAVNETSASSSSADENVPRDSLMPAPLKLRRTPPPESNSIAPPPPRPMPPRKGVSPARKAHMPRPSITGGQLAPLDSIGAPRMRSPSPKPVGMGGVPRTMRSSSAPRAPGPNPALISFNAPVWNKTPHSRSQSTNTNNASISYKPIPPPNTLYLDDLMDPLSQPSTQDQMAPSPVEQRPQPPKKGPAPPRPERPDEIVLSTEFLEEITIGPYQDLERPPPVPRKDTGKFPTKPSVKDQILVPSIPDSTKPSTATATKKSTPAAANQSQKTESPSEEGEDQGLRSMWLGEAQPNSLPLAPPPQRSISRTPPVRTPEMSEPDSETESDETPTPPRQPGGFSKQMDSPTSDYEDNEAMTPPMTIAEVEGDMPPRRTLRKSVPSMHEYMSLDQLEDMWGKQDRLGGGFFGGVDMMTMAVVSEEEEAGRPF